MIYMNNPRVLLSYSWHPEENKIRGELFGIGIVRECASRCFMRCSY